MLKMGGVRNLDTEKSAKTISLFFPRTISDWNQLDNTSHPTFDSFKKSVIDTTKP